MLPWAAPIGSPTTGSDGGTVRESDWEQLALERLAEEHLGWQPLSGREIAPGASSAVGHPGYAALGAQSQRESWAELAIPSRLRSALRRLNPEVPRQYLDQAAAEILRATSADAIAENERIHRYLTDGYRLTYIDEGRERSPSIRLTGAAPGQNEWLAVNQVTVISGEVERRFDLVLYLNGMPVVVMELKNASAGDDIATAQAQIATYVRELPSAFRFCVLTVVSDGVTARYGTPFTPLEHYAPWNVDATGAVVAPGGPPDASEGLDGPQQPLLLDLDVDRDTALDVLIDGLFDHARFLQLMRSFVAFDSGEDGLTKRIAKAHQYFAVTKAVEATVAAVAGDGRAGVVWHTQGSGKSMEMELYAALVARRPELENPTIVVVTDRTELDGQLYATFARSQLLPEQPRQVRRRSELREALSSRRTGGIYFTTLQKFGLTHEERDAGAAHPMLSERSNILLIVDEAHRSHYDNLDGYAWHLKNALPNATLLAFTGTPIDTADRNTREVFGDVIDTYDLTRAVEDGATVPVYFESRLVKVGLAEDVTAEEIDATADEVTTGLDDAERERLERSVAVINAVYGAPTRMRELAADLVTHWEARRDAVAELVRASSTSEGAPGKGLIVAATREICARLYEQIVTLRPDWHHDDLDRGRIKVVYSGTPADAPPISEHVRRESQNDVIKRRLKDPDDELELVIVKDMMLTGFDAPPLHTLYLDRPMRGALLMQTLARVNRTFRGKNAGLLVAYAPIAENLRDALAEYTERDRDSRPVGRTVEDAAGLARALVLQLRDLLGGSDWRAQLERVGVDGRGYASAALQVVDWLRSPRTPGNQVPAGQETRQERFRRLAGRLTRAWALCGRSEGLAELATEARFYEEVRVWMGKVDAEDRHARGEPIPDDVARLLADLAARSFTSGEVLDVYEAAGLGVQRIDQLDATFLAGAQRSATPQVTIELLRALIERESRAATRGNTIRARAFSDRLEAIMVRYTNSNLTSAEVIAELVQVANEVRAEKDRGRLFDPPLNPDELAFFDAVATNDAALELQGEGVLAQIARELVRIMRRDVKTDWAVRDDVRATLRRNVKRLLIKYDYPPDRREDAVVVVLEQMEAQARRRAA
ncbi:type I restriction endonuclease subunit R [Pseudactinotalea sp. HY158]|uniref:type I restriction endonuclease subunit R n=1 Tax=Pseudactinotalea sp. HY158 TaxID=2654547 RepID=UPI00129CBEA6|nr:HsdR family type I site-specific deoxyribonuclease [Pseudactinotalea sp. HY158]